MKNYSKNRGQMGSFALFEQKSKASNMLSSDTTKVVLLALALITLSLWIESNVGINLADEGFLWYGTTWTAKAKVPLRDFQSYDPGRYFWSAGCSQLLGNGIISLRVASGLFQLIGLTLGLLSLRKAIQSWGMLVVAGIVLIVWMIPYYKVFDSSIALAGVYFAFRLIETPSFRRHFIAGLFVGLAAFMGRNHGAYNCLAFFLLILLVWFKGDKTHLMKRMAYWLVGIIVGYSPMLIMFTILPGFFNSFIDGILSLLRSGRTNITLPIPWPWILDYSKMGVIQGVRIFLLRAFFVILPTYYLLTTMDILLCKRNQLQQKALQIACTLVGMMYMHHCFARADITHLAQGIHPFLIGSLSMPISFKFINSYKLKTIILMLILGMTFITAGFSRPYIKMITRADMYTDYNICGDVLRILKTKAKLIDAVKKINLHLVGPDEGLLLAPHWPTLYPILLKESPLWRIYFLVHEDELRQKEMINDLKKKGVNWVILEDVALDGRDDLRFRNTHELLWKHINEDFDVVKVLDLPVNCQLMHRRSDTGRERLTMDTL